MGMIDTVVVAVFAWIWRKLFPPKPRDVTVKNGRDEPLYVVVVQPPTSAPVVAQSAAEPARVVDNAGGGDFMPLSVRRTTTGLVRHADRGIRERVIATLKSARDSGATSEQLVACWPGDGSVDKVADCMRILASDKYGYPIERASDRSRAGAYVYRLGRE